MPEDAIPYDGVATKKQLKMECAHAEQAANFPDELDREGQLEQHLHFTLNDFAELIKQQGVHRVMKAMDEDTYWMLYKYFDD